MRVAINTNSFTGGEYAVSGNGTAPNVGGYNMIELPPQNIRMTHKIVGEDHPLTPNIMYNVKLTDIVLECKDGYQILTFYYVRVT